jgi:hypothetical protein
MTDWAARHDARQLSAPASASRTGRTGELLACLWDILCIYKKGRTVLLQTFDAILHHHFVERPVLGGQLRMRRWGADCQIGSLPAPQGQHSNM